jgi:hypothetical protein
MKLDFSKIKKKNLKDEEKRTKFWVWKTAVEERRKSILNIKL